MPMRKVRLLTPGPTMIPERLQQIMAAPILHHRSPEFQPIFDEAKARLKKLFQTEQEVLMLASSGTGAMEGVVTTLFAPKDKVIAVDAGKFGQRWRKMGDVFGLEVVPIEVEWGQAVRVEQIEAIYQKHPDCRGIFIQGVETSTGVVHPVEAIAKWKQKSAREVFLCVDGITSLGVMPLPMDAWGIDAMVTGSQKALMLPPGLSLVAMSARAWQRAEQVGASQPKYYFDLIRERKSQAKGESAYTPAITLILGLVESLRMQEEEGYEAIYKRTARYAHASREAAKALGCEVFAKQPSPSITALLPPPGVDAGKLVKMMRDQHGFTLIGGQDHLKGKIFRIGHMGYLDEYDLLATFGALERCCRVLNPQMKFSWGVSMGAFLKALEETP